MLFDLPALIKRVEDLHDFVVEFSVKEMDEMICHMHAVDKADGSDVSNVCVSRNVGIHFF